MARIRIVTSNQPKSNNVFTLKEHRYVRRYKLFRNLFIISSLIAIIEAIHIGIIYGHR